MDTNCPLPPTSQAIVLTSRQVIKNEVLVKCPLCMLSLSLKIETFDFCLAGTQGGTQTPGSEFSWYLFYTTNSKSKLIEFE